MSRSERIEWNGQLVGHIEGVWPETMSHFLNKFRGRWVPLQNQVAQDFLREAEEHNYVEVGTGRDPMPGKKEWFRLDFKGGAWLLDVFDEEWLTKEIARNLKQDDSV